MKAAQRGKIANAKNERLRRYRVMIEALMLQDRTPAELATHANCHVANARELIQAMEHFGLVRKVSPARSTPITVSAVYSLTEESKISPFFDFINVCQSVMEERGILETVEDEIEAERKRNAKDIRPFFDPMIWFSYGRMPA